MSIEPHFCISTSYMDQTILLSVCVSSSPFSLSGIQVGPASGGRSKKSEWKKQGVPLFIDSNSRTSYLLVPSTERFSLDSSVVYCLSPSGLYSCSLLHETFSSIFKIATLPSVHPRSCFIFLRSTCHQLKLYLFSLPVSPNGGVSAWNMSSIETRISIFVFTAISPTLRRIHGVELLCCIVQRGHYVKCALDLCSIHLYGPTWWLPQ